VFCVPHLSLLALEDGKQENLLVNQTVQTLPEFHLPYPACWPMFIIYYRQIHSYSVCRYSSYLLTSSARKRVFHFVAWRLYVQRLRISQGTFISFDAVGTVMHSLLWQDHYQVNFTQPVTSERNKLSTRTFFLPQLISLSFLGTIRQKPCGFALPIIAKIFNLFLGSFTIFRKETIRFVMSVRLCVSMRMEQLGSHRTDFHEIGIWVLLENMWRKLKCHRNLTRITGTVIENVCTFMIISCWILLRMRNVSDGVVEKIRTHFYSTYFFFRKSCN
jgi:hypothetical protein